MANYATLDQANDYFRPRLYTEIWDAEDPARKDKALTVATASINQLAYMGRPTPAALAAGNQFPRGSGGGSTDPYSPWSDDQTVPDDIMHACCEEASSLLTNNPDDAFRDTGIKSEAYSSVRVEYTDTSALEMSLSGITSPTAWRLLLPYLRDKRNLNYKRI
jgi:hypothetical protein